MTRVFRRSDQPNVFFKIVASLAILLQLPISIHATSDAASVGADTTSTSQTQTRELGNKAVDYSIYGMSMQRADWFYDAKSISIKFLGCEWGYVDADNGENMGCMPNDSGDGTTSWYQMANCKRAQVVYSMYASTGSTSCSKGHFKESFITQNGVSEFAYLLGNYGYNSPISQYDTQNFAVCEYDGNTGYYASLGCDGSGGFTTAYFSDQYCLEPTGTYDNSYMSSFNKAMKNLNCYSVYSNSYDANGVDNSLAAYLIADSGSCSESESSLCTTSSFVSSAGSGGYQRARSFGAGASLTFSNKVKYTLGSAMLLGSVIMFIGILFTNRRKRHAIMHRKFRQSSDKKKKKKRSSSSKKSGKSNGKSSKSSRSSRKSSSNGVFA